MLQSQSRSFHKNAGVCARTAGSTKERSAPCFAERGCISRVFRLPCHMKEERCCCNTTQLTRPATRSGARGYHLRAAVIISARCAKQGTDRGDGVRGARDRDLAMVERGRKHAHTRTHHSPLRESPLSLSLASLLSLPPLSISTETHLVRGHRRKTMAPLFRLSRRLPDKR